MISHCASSLLSPALIADVEFRLMSEIFFLDKIRALVHRPDDTWTQDEKLSLFSALCQLMTGKDAWKNYRQRSRSLLFNMRHSPEIQRRAQEATLTGEWIVSASHQALWPERWENLKRPAHLDPFYNVSDADAPTTNQFQCGKCHKRTTTFTQLQTRRADEGMTTFVRCTSCENRWRIG